MEVAKRIGRACEEIGFFIVVNHGIPKDVIDAAWNKTLAFFDLPAEVKTKFTSDDDVKYPYGYSALGGENLARGKRVDGAAEDKGAGDMKEMMAIGPKDPRSGMSERRLPSKADLEGFGEAWEEYYEQANALANRLLSAFALALELPEDFFVSMVDKHISAMRANNYPCQQGMVVPAGSIRASGKENATRQQQAGGRAGCSGKTAASGARKAKRRRAVVDDSDDDEEDEDYEEEEEELEPLEADEH